MGSCVVLMEFIPPNREDGLFNKFSLMIHLLGCLQSWDQAGLHLASGLVSSQASVRFQKQSQAGSRRCWRGAWVGRDGVYSWRAKMIFSSLVRYGVSRRWMGLASEMGGSGTQWRKGSLGFEYHNHRPGTLQSLAS